MRGTFVPNIPEKLPIGTVIPSGVTGPAGYSAVTGAVPSTENGTVVDLFAKRPPRRRKNTDARPREHLTEAEVARLREAAKTRGHYGNRDALMILMAYRHGL
jgi:hypothetical protein